MFFLCHPWFTTTNLSYTFPNFETSATASCGSTGIFTYIALKASDVAHPCASFLSIAISNILRVICFQVADGGNPLVKCYSCNCPSTWGSDAPLLWTCRSCLLNIQNWEPMHPETSCNRWILIHTDWFGMIKSWFILIQHIAGIEPYSYTAILQLTVVFFSWKTLRPSWIINSTSCLKHETSASTELHASLWSCRGCHGFDPLGNVCHSIQKLQQTLCLRARWRSFLKVPVATLCIFWSSLILQVNDSMNSRFEKLLCTVNVPNLSRHGCTCHFGRSVMFHIINSSMKSCGESERKHRLSL